MRVVRPAGELLDGGRRLGGTDRPDRRAVLVGLLVRARHDEGNRCAVGGQPRVGRLLQAKDVLGDECPAGHGTPFYLRRPPASLMDPTNAAVGVCRILRIWNRWAVTR